jgi:hypothetical protein
MTSPVEYAAFAGTAPDDVWSDVAELFIETFTAEPYAEDAAELATITQWGSDQLGHVSGRLITARRGDQLVGFALAHGLRDDAPWRGILSQLADSADAAATALSRPDEALIVHELAVRESERGRGIASGCLRGLLSDCPESQVFIGVYERALKARAMYRHWRLEDIGQVPMPDGAVALHVLTAPTATLRVQLDDSASRQGAAIDS